MTDIVKRLRMGLATPIELEAADEIERLCKSHERMAENAAAFAEAMSEKNAEIARLRGLLEIAPRLMSRAHQEYWEKKLREMPQQ